MTDIDSAAPAAARPRDVPAANGWSWIKAALRLFTKAPLMWWVLIFLWVLIYILFLGVFGVVGEVVLAVMYPAYSAGLMIGCRSLQKGESLELGHLLAGFQANPRQLIILGVIIVGCGLLLGAVTALIAPFDQAAIAELSKPEGDPNAKLQALSSLMPAMALQAIAALPVMLAVWFSPALLAFNKMSAVDSIRWSVYACVSNMGAFGWYGLLLIGFSFVTAFTFGLGLIVLVPTVIATGYTSYMDIFEPAAES